jgi:hypothetical protein
MGVGTVSALEIHAVPSASSDANKALLSSLLGSTIEWYEFFIYGTAAALVFNRAFFPQFDVLAGTLLSLSTFTIAFIARPVGAAIFGHFGDRVGRKATLVVTLTMMGACTFLIGLLPTYENIGVWAAVATAPTPRRYRRSSPDHLSDRTGKAHPRVGEEIEADKKGKLRWQQARRVTRNTGTGISR